jgi:hypothetical protein
MALVVILGVSVALILVYTLWLMSTLGVGPRIGRSGGQKLPSP